MQSATLIAACGTIAKSLADKWIGVQFARHARLTLPLHGGQSGCQSSSAQHDHRRRAAGVMTTIRIALLPVALALSAAAQHIGRVLLSFFRNESCSGSVAGL